MPPLINCNTEAIEAYKLNIDADANAWKLLEEIGRKAALVDEMAEILSVISIFENVKDHIKIAMKLSLKKYDALPK